MQETQVRSLGQEDTLEKGWQPTPVFLSGEFHGQRSLEGCSSRGQKESDKTVRLTSVPMDVVVVVKVSVVYDSL